VETTIDDVRDLAHGIYPPLLADGGLSEALPAATARAALPARAEVNANGRYPPQVESAVYFCCLEALQNAAKHAGAGAKATVRLWQEADRLRFEIADDGAGFSRPRAREGAGLTNMRDRLGAVGGSLEITSKRSSGTRVLGSIPLA
jgi:signal transduction histidine kinase